MAKKAFAAAKFPDKSAISYYGLSPMQLDKFTTLVILLIAGCSAQPGNASTVPLQPNMKMFVDSFDGTKVGAKTALTKFNLPKGDDGYQIADYNVQGTNVTSFQEDQSCYVIEFLGALCANVA